MAEYGQAAAQGDGPKVLAKAAGALGSNSNSASNPWCVLGQVIFLWVSYLKWRGMVESPHSKS